MRFIELMPIGFGTTMKRVSTDDILTVLRERWPDLAETDEKRGNGPAHYYKSGLLKGRIGFIDAVSHKFCSECNRVRLTSTRHAEALPVLLGYDGSSRAHTF